MTTAKSKAPKHLQAPTRRWFDSVVSDYELEPHHERLLTLAGEAWDRCAAARIAIQKHGLTYEDRFGQPRKRPEISVEIDNRIAFARLVRELGLDVSEPADSRPNVIRGNASLRIAGGN